MTWLGVLKGVVLAGGLASTFGASAAAILRWGNGPRQTFVDRSDRRQVHLHFVDSEGRTARLPPAAVVRSIGAHGGHQMQEIGHNLSLRPDE